MKQNYLKIFMLCLFFFVGMSAYAYDCKIDGIYYDLNTADNTASVTTDGYWSGYYSGTVNIPESIVYNEVIYTVTSIGVYAFNGCGGLTEVTIPNSIVSIGDYAFDGCSGLTELTIPNSVTSIGERAFYGCSGLEKIVVDIDNPYYDSREACNAVIRKDGNVLVVGCKNTLIPNSVTSIGDEAFYNCRSLTELVIPNSVTSIGNRAFEYCSGLTELTIPNSVTSIGNYAFEYCSGLTELTIGNSVTSIGDWAFEDCSGLTELTIPNSVMSIGERAFSGCSSLEKIIVASDNPYYDSREDCNAIIRTDDNELIAGCNYTHIPSSVASIGTYAFRYCSGLTELVISNSMTHIGDNAFFGCSGLERITVEEGNPYYDSRNDCNAIIRTNDNELITGCNNTYIPNGVVSIGANAFAYCSGLMELTIPNSVTHIGNGAFWRCLGLTELTIPNSVTHIGRNAFMSCSYLTSISSLSPVPPTIEGPCFDNLVYQNAILHVLVGCKEVYQQANYWWNFYSIVDDATTAIESVTSDKQSKTAIYTLDGKRINTANAADLPNGIYIVNGKKVVVK